MYTKKLVVSMVSLLACFTATKILAAPALPTHSSSSLSSSTPNLQEFTLQPRFNLWGYSGNNTLGQGQLLAPIYGDSSKILYGLAESNVAVNNDGWLLGGGFGYRQAVNNSYLLGGYALVDYNNTLNNNKFWIINPGLEMLGQTWDINVNGYLPVGKNKKQSEEKIWADNISKFTKSFEAHKLIRFTEHSEFAHQFQLFEEAGQGASVEVGRVVPHFNKAKFYLGSYYFSTKDAGSTTGVEARLTYELNKYAALEVKDTYDNTFHNQAMLGIRLTLGGYNDEQKQSFGIATRLTDPLEHTFARFNGATKSSTKTKFVDLGESPTPEHDNLWFFKPATTSNTKNAPASNAGDGTFENPFISFDKTNFNQVQANANIGVIDPFPLLYFSPGSYSFQSFVTSPTPPRFGLPNGWGMFGRTADYVSPAMGSNRAQFEGGIDLEYTSGAGNAQTTLNSIVVNEAASDIRAALFLLNASNVVLQNSDIEPSPGLNGIAVRNSTLNFNALDQADAGTTTVNYNLSAGTPGLGNNGINITSAANDNNNLVNFNGGVNLVSGGSSNNNNSDNGIFINANQGSTTVNFVGGVNTVNGGNNNSSSAITNASNGILALNNSGNTSIIFSGGVNTVNGGSSNIQSINSFPNSNGISVVDNDGNTTITFAGGVNPINGGNSNSQTSDNQQNSNGISVVDNGGITSITFAGGTNTINGGNSSNDSTNGDNRLSSNGIFLFNNSNTANLTFSGGVNTINGGNSSNKNGNNYSNSNGIFSNSTSPANFTFNGGINTINGGNNSTQNTSSADDDNSNGIDVTNTDVIFSGGTNTINGGSNNTTNTSNFNNSNGIGVDTSNITFIDGINTINGGNNTSGNFGTTNNNGINAFDTTIIFDNFNKPAVVTITAKQNSANGIFADGLSKLQYVDSSGVPQDFTTGFPNIDAYATFSHTGSGGNAIDWDGNTLPW